jgi:hypothetical protein
MAKTMVRMNNGPQEGREIEASGSEVFLARMIEHRMRPVTRDGETIVPPHQFKDRYVIVDGVGYYFGTEVMG